MPKLFSYGTLQQKNVQQATFGRHLIGTSDVLIGYQLRDVKIENLDVIAKSGKDILFQGRRHGFMRTPHRWQILVIT